MGSSKISLFSNLQKETWIAFGDHSAHAKSIRQARFASISAKLRDKQLIARQKYLPVD
jgi:hypothetical protein